MKTGELYDYTMKQIRFDHELGFIVFDRIQDRKWSVTVNLTEGEPPENPYIRTIELAADSYPDMHTALFHLGNHYQNRIA